MNPSSTVSSEASAKPAPNGASGGGPSGTPAPRPYAPPQVGQLMQEIERMERDLQEKMELLNRQKEEQESRLVAERNSVIEEFKAKLGVTSDRDLVLVIRNRGKDVNSKAKRIPQAMLEEMKWALKNGATAPAVAKHFRVSLATVHARKAAWRLTHRKGVKATPIHAALKGFPKASQA